MKAALLILPLTAGALAIPAIGGAQAVDHGQYGETWPVIEPDLMEVIKNRLETAERNGQLEELNRQFAEKVKARVMRPTPVAGLRHAVEDRVWEYDPAVTIERDVHDHKGNLIAAAGQRVNPLDHMALSQKMVFVDGDRPEEIAFARSLDAPEKLKIIFVKGSPFEMMRSHQQRFYFDQGGKLIGKFGIRHTPAVVEQDGDVLLVTEKALPGGSAS
jgi:conjugal transfer pilus assembly protein TraW